MSDTNDNNKNNASSTDTQQRVLDALRDARSQIEALQKPRDERIAVIGMAARLPGAESVEAFWDMLQAGRSGIRILSDEELREAGIDDNTIANEDYVAAWSSFNDPAAFDAGFFGYSPREATVLDPQQRVFLECAWHAMEDAGLQPGDDKNRVGVYAGAALNKYLIDLNNDREIRESVTPLQAVISNVMGLLPTRTAYHLDLNGPACGVQTACSTSLVAIHNACRSLLDNDCDVALAGGATVCLPTPQGYIHEKGGIASPDGKCRAFDVEGEGTVFGNGVGVVVLKPLAAARADGDNIHAVICGSAINNDGADKVGLLAPSVSGQSSVIAEAWRRSGIDPGDVDYIEAHGTATELGDPIEFAALDKALGAALRKQERQCAMGSVKTNVGHLDAAAGVAGLIKTILAMQHEQLPPSLHYKKPNPQMTIDDSPFHVVAETTPWPRGGRPRRAGISSFGMGGTNAHIVIEEPTSSETRAACDEQRWQLIPLSAKQPAALNSLASDLSAHLKTHRQLAIDDIAHTLQSGRQAMSHRRLYLARNRDEAISNLDASVLPGLQNTVDEIEPSLVFMFSGQGSQYPGMARQLINKEPVFRDALQQCADLLAADIDLLELISANTDPDVLNRTEHTQPVLFSIEYALAKLWQSRGIEADAMIGHSIGEYVAACLAGVFSLQDALNTVALRGRLMQACDTGAMLAILQDRDAVQAYLNDDIELAAHNSNDSCVVAGTTTAIAALETKLNGDDVVCRRLEVSHAFHTAMMQPALDAFANHLNNISLNTPNIEFVSNLTGDWITNEQATDAAYWVDHLRHTVRFADGLQSLTSLGNPVFLEIGAGETLSRFVTATLGQQSIAIASLPGIQQAMHTERFFNQAFGRLWLAGLDIDWQGLWSDANRPAQTVSLPGYPFDRVHLFPQADSAAATAMLATSVDADSRSNDISRWYHLPCWDRVPLDRNVQCESQYRIVAGEDALRDTLINASTHNTIQVEAGQAFVCNNASHYVINPQSENDYQQLFAALKQQDISISQWIQFPAENGAHDLDALVAMAQALRQFDDELLLTAISREAAQVTGAETGDATHACVVGMLQVMSQEIVSLDCRVIDLSANSNHFEQTQLINELDAQNSVATRLVALRGRYRWLKSYRQQQLETEQSELLQQEAAYVIVGDLLGGLGMIYARLLRQHLNARVIIIGGEQLPDIDSWQQHLTSQTDSHAVNQFIHRMQSLGEQDEHWQLHRIDITDEKALAQAIAHGSMRFGPIAGVFHADVMGDIAACGLEQLDVAKRTRIMRNKVQGTQALANCLASHTPGFVLLQSSMSAIAGGPGFAAYAAANCFLDAFASLNDSATRWLSVNWDACQLDDELATNTQQASALMANAFSYNEVWQATQRVLAEPELIHAVVTAKPLMPRIQQAFDKQAAMPAAGQSHQRPDMDIEYIEPQTPVEQAVATAMSELLGIDKVGRNDDFFALGGNSLLAIQAVTRLRKEFGVELPMRALLFGTPTVAGIAEVVEQNLEGLSDDNMAAVEDLLDQIENMTPEEAANQQ